MSEVFEYQTLKARMGELIGNIPEGLFPVKLLVALDRFLGRVKDPTGAIVDPTMQDLKDLEEFGILYSPDHK